MKYSGVGNSHNNSSTLFCEQVSTVTSLFEKWNECERTVVMYALLKRLPYPTIKFLQCSIENNIINNQTINLITRQQYLKNDLNANDINYLQKLLSAYKIDDNNCNYNNYNTNNIITSQLLTPPLTDKDSILLYESDSSNSTSNSSTISSNKHISSSNNNINTIQSASAQLQQHGLINNRNNKICNKKEEILKDILTILPLLKPGNDEVKNIYLSIIPLAVEDTVKQIVNTDIVQQIFSYLLIHPAIRNEDRRSLSRWLRHLEDHIQSLCNGERNFYILTNNSNTDNTSLSKSSSLGGGICTGSGGVGIINNNNSNSINKNTWQAIAPPSSQQLNFQNRRFQQQQQQQITNSIFCSSGDNGSSGSSTISGGSGCPSSITTSSIYSGSEWNMNLSQLTDNICDDFQHAVKIPITKNLTKSSENNLGLIYDGINVNSVNNNNTSNGTSCAGSSSGSSNLNLSINNNNNNINDDHHVSFSKNGTEIIDFDDINQSCDKCNTQIVGYNSVMLCCCDHQQNIQKQNNLLIGSTTITSSSSKKTNYNIPNPSLSAAAALIAVPHQSELPRWNLDGNCKLSSIKTRRSNSLTTPAIISSTTSSSSSSSTSSVITVNDNCSSNSSENLSQYTQKPRSYSLSIENPRGALSSSGSDTRLDDMKQPNYMKFQTHNIGMSNIGQWLKSLRLHKYIGLFTTITYEDMLEITEDYLQSLGVTKGASHKLALCIDKLKDRYYHLIQLEQDLLSGQITLTAIIEELTNIVLTPMKPVDSSLNNVAYKFLQVLELVSSTVVKKEVNTIQDEDCVNALLWILERSIHAEAFLTHTNQLKEQKFKLSKLKAQFSPKIHPQHNKNGSNGSLNKPRWTKSRNKNDNTKSGSIDRINNRKNSHDIVSFSLNTLQQQNNTTTTGGSNSASTIHNLSNNNLHDIEKYHLQQQQQQQHKNQSGSTSSNSSVGSSIKLSSTSSTSTTQPHFKLNSSSNSCSSGSNSSCGNGSLSNSSCPQYKSSSYPNFSNTGGNSCGQITNQQQQQQHQQLHQHQQQLQQHQHQLQHQHNQQYRHHRHSLNNLIVVSSNPQQPQQMIFKQGKGGFSKIDSTICIDKNMGNIVGKNHRRSSITKTVVLQTNLDNGVNNAGNNSHKKSNNNEKTFAEIIAVSNNNNNNNNGNNYNNNSINNIKSSSLLNCGNIINVIGSCDGDGISINNVNSNNGGDNNIIIDSNCCNSGLITTTTTTTQSINNTTNILNENSKDINNQKLSKNNLNDINRSLEQLEFLCLQMTEQAIN